MQNTNTTQTQTNGLLDMAIKFMEAGTHTWSDVYAEVAKNLNITTEEAAKAVAARYMATR